MSKKLPFEEALSKRLNDLPRPDEDDSWQKMAKLLEKKDDRKPPIAFFNRNAGWILISMLLVIGLWVGISKLSKTGEVRHSPVVSKREGGTILNNKTISETKKASPEGTGSPTPKDHTSINKNTFQQKSSNSDKANPTPPLQNSHLLVVKDEQINAGSKIPLASNNIVRFHKASNQTPKDISKKQQPSPLNLMEKRSKNSLTTEIADPLQTPQNVVERTDVQNEMIRHDTGQNSIINDTALQHIQPKSDSVKLVREDTVAKSQDIVKATPIKIATAKQKRILFSAGLGLQQQIKIGGQASVRYGFNNANRITDYIPSLWLRMHPNDKWYVQGEFIYAAPQLVKEFAYSRQTRADSSNSIVTTTLRLKKTFFSEIPVSVNYFLKPGWSIGAGATYSWFHGAIAEKETLTKTSPGQTQSQVNQIVPITGFTDSFLYRSHTFLLLQTDYQWKQMSLGLRYSKDVQPYITYTLPDGRVADGKNWSLELLFRLRLWKSLRFNH